MIYYLLWDKIIESKFMLLLIFWPGFVEPWFLPDFLASNIYDQQDAAFLLTIIGISSLAGRILAGVLEPFLR
jgi:hypothetical protein